MAFLDPDYLTVEREAPRRQPIRFDGIGLFLLVTVIACWEVMLSRGQEWDMPSVGRALVRGTDARWIVAGGLLTMAAGNYRMSRLNLDISPAQAVWPRVMLIAGLAICFAPDTRPRASGLR